MTDKNDTGGAMIKSVEEIEAALRLYQEDTTVPDRITNVERRRTLLWVLDRESEANGLEYKADAIGGGGQ